MSHPIWAPKKEKASHTQMAEFQARISKKIGKSFENYFDFHQWSVNHPSEFWGEIWDACSVIGDKGSLVVEDFDKMPGAKWFPEAKLNFAENLLRKNDESDAIVFYGEDKVQKRWSFRELQSEVSRVEQGLRKLGIEPKDRVVGWLPNMPETVAASLGAIAIGATWSSSSPDFGSKGVLDRFGQIDPQVLFAVDGYFYNGRWFDCLGKLEEVARKLPSLKKVVVISYEDKRPDLTNIPNAVLWEDFLGEHSPKAVQFERFGFDHPLYILYSSGTTGVPKCIVHGVGGTLLQHVKEHRFHTDIREGERVFYFTTCGWMMWNWLITALSSNATLVLYDGSPFYPDGNVLWEMADREKVQVFGTSAKYIDALQKNGIHPKEKYALSELRAVLSTGSPLVPESFEYVYSSIKEDVCLSSISGGTDIVSCFMLGNPTLPVFKGEIQCFGLGMDVDVFDGVGASVTQQKGELVCKKPFPSMPIYFWKDEDGARYRQAYFDRFDGVWCHGDWVEVTKNGGVLVYGRSDATLNPGGVRIGTAEIYRQVEQIDAVIESVAVGQDWEGDVRVILFVVLRDGQDLSEELITKIKKQIRQNTTPRHVPAKVIQVTDIPRTRSGKITELAIREVIHGRPVKNAEALSNPESLKQYQNLQDLKA